jgi:hypothetical protein
MDVLILAGGKCRPNLAQGSGCEWRADLMRGDRTFLQITLDAVKGLGVPILVGPVQTPDALWVRPGETFSASLRNGLERVVADHVLVTTADMPWLTKEAVEGFLQRVDEADDLTYPIIRADDCTRRYPGLSRTSVQLKEGRFTGGNLILARTESLRRALPIVDQGYRSRKSPLALAKMIGLGTAARLALGFIVPGALTVPYLESRVSRLLRCQVRGQICPFPELGADIDSHEQYQIMKELEKSAT